MALTYPNQKSRYGRGSKTPLQHKLGNGGRGTARGQGGFVEDVPGPNVAPVGLGFVRFAVAGSEVEILLGDGLVTITGGYGGWEEIGRPHKKPITHWAAGSRFRMTVPIQFENFLQGLSIQNQIGRLERMGRANGGDSEPPRVRCVLPAGQPRSPKVDWVVEDIAWEGEERNTGGQRIRSIATVTLLEYGPDELVKESSAKRRRRQGNPNQQAAGAANNAAAMASADLARARSLYVVKRGDTLAKIAQKVLGDKDRARDIRRVNDIRDQSRIEVGDKLRMP